MAVRSATRDDTNRIREIAEASFQASYSLSPLDIETIVEELFVDDALAERLADDDGRVFVAESEDEDGTATVAGFAMVEPEAGLRWLHVDPAFRGRGLATALFERVEDDAEERGRSLTARILQTANEGHNFLERFGLQESGTARLEFDEEEFVENVYATNGDSTEPNEPDVEVPDSVTVDGRELALDRDEEIPGTDAPFFALYTDADGDERYGFFCSACGSTDVSADGLDRIECAECGNVHRADQWDDAYL